MAREGACSERTPRRGGPERRNVATFSSISGANTQSLNVNFRHHGASSESSSSSQLLCAGGRGRGKERGKKEGHDG